MWHNPIICTKSVKIIKYKTVTMQKWFDLRCTLVNTISKLKINQIDHMRIFRFLKPSSVLLKSLSQTYTANRSATSPRPKFKTIAEVAEESQLGFAVGRRLVGDWSATNRGLVADWSADWSATSWGTSLRLDATGRRPVGDRSPTSRRPVADRSPTKLT